MANLQGYTIVLAGAFEREGRGQLEGERRNNDGVCQQVFTITSFVFSHN